MGMAPHRQVVEFVTQQEPFFYEPDEVSMLTQERLKELFYYNKQFGFLVRKKSRYSGKVGTIAGSIKPNGYAEVRIAGKYYSVHRLVFLYVNGELPPYQADHINGIRNDNRWVNLRAVSAHENQKNQKKPSNNTSGIRGVGWIRLHNKWQSRISIDKRRVNLGYFDDFFEACCMRKAAEIRYGYHPNHGR